MPNPSELERADQEQFDRAAPTPCGDLGEQLYCVPKTREQIEADIAKEMEYFDNGKIDMPGVGDFERKLEALINEHSMEGCGGDTPDFILARFLRLQLEIFHVTVRRREHWHGRDGKLVDTAEQRQSTARVDG